MTRQAVFGYTERMSSNAANSAENGRPAAAGTSQVNYEGMPLVELTIDAKDYRIDSGKQGTALSVSSRESGSWDWLFVAEARWDGSALRSRAIERPVLELLSRAFAQAVADLE